MTSGASPSVLTVDTEGDAPEVVPVVAPDKLGSADECIDENLDALAGELREDVAPETETMPDASEDANTMATDMMEKTLEEAAALQLGDDSDARAIEDRKSVV